MDHQHSTNLMKSRHIRYSPTDYFQCQICYEVPDKLVECQNCQNLYCSKCIGNIKMQSNTCSYCKQNPLRSVDARVINNIMEELRTKYKNAVHSVPEVALGKQCVNHEFCFSNVNPHLKNYCDESCELLHQIRKQDVEEPFSYGIHLALIRQFKQELMDLHQRGRTEFNWDLGKAPDVLASDLRTKRVFLTNFLTHESISVLGDKPLESGQHYWEIELDSRTECELKIGVSLKKDPTNPIIIGAFSDTPQGFAYYGRGQLRNGPDYSRTSYGKKFRESGVIGVYLDMDNGILSFSLDGECFGKAFESERLRRGPIWAAVALTHIGGCRLITGKALPLELANERRV